jgi:hypothetical protein
MSVLSKVLPMIGVPVLSKPMMPGLVVSVSESAL